MSDTQPHTRRRRGHKVTSKFFTSMPPATAAADEREEGNSDLSESEVRAATRAIKQLQARSLASKSWEEGGGARHSFALNDC